MYKRYCSISKAKPLFPFFERIVSKPIKSPIRLFAQCSYSTSVKINPEFDNNPQLDQINNYKKRVNEKKSEKIELNLSGAHIDYSDSEAPQIDLKVLEKINLDTIQDYKSTAYNTHLKNNNEIYADRMPGLEDDIWIGMSSGVDSSTAAALLVEKYGKDRVKGIFMANWDSVAAGGNSTKDGKQSNAVLQERCDEKDWQDVQTLCKNLGISCERVNFEQEYWQDVFEPMIEMYRIGQTPNPDVGCNKYIKFGSLIKHLEKKYINTDGDNGNSDINQRKWWLATGHYARVATHLPSNSVHLLRPDHLPKDQSYYLSTISSSVLQKIFFPLSHFPKPLIRQLAKYKYNLITADKPDSQGLCFVSQNQNKFRAFLDEYLEPNPGNIVRFRHNKEDGTREKVIVGQHNGIWHATVGQKSGVMMPQGNEETKGTWYVQSKNYDTNEIVIVKGNSNPSLFTQHITSKDFEWLVDPETLSWSNSSVSTAVNSNKEIAATTGKILLEWKASENDDTNDRGNFNESKFYVQYRSLQLPEPVKTLRVEKANVTSAESLPLHSVTVELQTARRAVAPGQYLVIYRDNCIVGSGVISKTTPIVEP